MGGAVVVLARVAIVYTIFRMAWSLLVPKRQADTDQKRKRTSACGKTRRFDTSTLDVSDGDFEDVKET
jgi:hypothetical protein